MSRKLLHSQRRRKRTHDRRYAQAPRRLTGTGATQTALRRVKISGHALRGAVQRGIDWRHQHTIVAGDQESCESCTSFAVAAAITLQGKIVGKQLLISPGYLHTCLGHQSENDARVICATAVDPHWLLHHLRDVGWQPQAEQSYPYPPSACRIGGRPERLRSVTPISSGQQAKRALEKGPLVVEMRAPPSFFTFTGKLYRDAVRHDHPLHTVCVIGYDDDGWIILNSKGTTWGDGSGCATIEYGRCQRLAFMPGIPPLAAFAITL